MWRCDVCVSELVTCKVSARGDRRHSTFAESLHLHARSVYSEMLSNKLSEREVLVTRLGARYFMHLIFLRTHAACTRHKRVRQPPPGTQTRRALTFLPPSRSAPSPSAISCALYRVQQRAVCAVPLAARQLDHRRHIATPRLSPAPAARCRKSFGSVPCCPIARARGVSSGPRAPRAQPHPVRGAASLALSRGLLLLHGLAREEPQCGAPCKSGGHEGQHAASTKSRMGNAERCQGLRRCGSKRARPEFETSSAYGPLTACSKDVQRSWGVCDRRLLTTTGRERSNAPLGAEDLVACDRLQASLRRKCAADR